MSESNEAQWGPIVVIGGTGRLGIFLIDELLRQPECGRIVSINRNPAKTKVHEGRVEYHAVDLRDASKLREVIQKVQPEIIFNTAAPAHANGLTPASEFEETLVGGQDNLIKLAQESGTRYLIGTTSANVAAGHEHLNVDELAPLWPEDSSAFPYWVKRAKAERLLLAADSLSLQTVSLRLPLIIGERDYAFTPAMLRTLKEGKTSVQVGHDTGLLSTVPVTDAVRAHILTLREIRKPNNGVHGESFYILGMQPMSFWSMGRVIWNEAGWQAGKKPWIIPQWLANAIAAPAEKALFLFSGGTKEPQMTRHVIRFMCNTWTYNGEKAKQRLGYVPQDDIEEQLRKSVRWELDQNHQQR